MREEDQQLNGGRRVAGEQAAGEWRAATQRACDSAQFCKAARMRELLSYLTERSFEDAGREVTEYEIAEKVFGRGEKFHPSESNVVRVGVRQLRAKLKEYYDVEGSGERWEIELPKGGYRVTFRERKVGVAEADGHSRGTRWSGVAWAAVVGVLLLLSAGLWFENRRLREGVERTREPSFLAALAGTFGGPLQVVTADPGAVIMRRFGVAPKDLQDYESGGFYRSFDAGGLPAVARGAFETVASRQLMNVGDVNIATRLFGQLGTKSPSLRVARLMRAREFRGGSYILLGSSSSNPWYGVFAGHFNFRFEIPAGQPEVLVNHKPRGGEPGVFAPRAPDTEESHALVAMTSNLTGTGRVVLIAGYTMEATEAAGDFVLNPAERGRILSVLGAKSEGELGGFEMVLKTRSVSGTGRSAEIVAHRSTGAR